MNYLDFILQCINKVPLKEGSLWKNLVHLVCFYFNSDSEIEEWNSKVILNIAIVILYCFVWFVAQSSVHTSTHIGTKPSLTILCQTFVESNHIIWAMLKTMGQKVEKNWTKDIGAKWKQKVLLGITWLRYT